MVRRLVLIASAALLAGLAVSGHAGAGTAAAPHRMAGPQPEPPKEALSVSPQPTPPGKSAHGRQIRR